MSVFQAECDFAWEKNWNTFQEMQSCYLQTHLSFKMCYTNCSLIDVYGEHTWALIEEEN